MIVGENIALSQSEFHALRDLIRRYTGITLKEVKKSLVASRLGKQVRRLGLNSFQAYYEYLRTGDPKGVELVNMINAITTNKTSFFREPQHFDVFASFAAAIPGRIRVWSAACSTGEEPYSISITLLNRLGETRAKNDISIRASDIDTGVLETAEQGIYAAEAAEEFNESLRRRYLLRGYGKYAGSVMVKPKVRSLVHFERLNLMDSDYGPRAHFDAVFCRNVMIYFDEENQARVLERLTRVIRPGGLLFIGSAETLFRMREAVRPVAHSVYRVLGAEKLA